ncbi:MAG: corrinoid protein [Candidatus Hydrogenedentota bacterium]|nr:MAG: corrinoid protein [Candidatus Hydrogenedentota bacterium]
MELTTRCVEKGLSIKDILYKGLINSMDEVGKKYEEGQYFLPDLIASADAMIAGMKILKPYLLEEKIESRGKVIMATVEGDEHDIGKNLVIIMLRAAGFTVVDLGTRVPAEEIIRAVADHKPDLVGLSALLTSTMPHMKETIEELEKLHLRGNVRIMVGGAPVSREFADSIGADAYGEDAFEAVEKAKELVIAL